MFCSPPGRASAQLGAGRAKILRLAFQVTTASQQKKTLLFVFTSAPPATGQLLSRLFTQSRDWLGVDYHFGVDVEEGFTLASLIMRNSDLFLGDLDRFRLLVFGFSQLLTLRTRPIYDVGFEVLTVQQVFLRFIFEGRQYPVKGLLQITEHRKGMRVYTDINDGNVGDFELLDRSL